MKKKKKKKKAPWNNTPWPTRVSLVSVFFGTEKPPIIWLGLPFFFFASSSLFFLFHSSAFFFSFLRPLLRLHRLRLGTTSSYRRGRNADRLLFLFDFFFWVLKKKFTEAQRHRADHNLSISGRFCHRRPHSRRSTPHRRFRDTTTTTTSTTTTTTTSKHDLSRKKKNYVSIRLRWAETHLDLAKPFLTW